MTEGLVSGATINTGSTWADIPELDHRLREHEYRRGYLDGWIEAVNALERVWFLRTKTRIGNTLYNHWAKELNGWLFADNCERLVEPPCPSVLTCVYCGEQTASQLDHVMPKSRGGPDTDDNLVPCCAHCNMSKGARTPEEWKAIA